MFHSLLKLLTYFERLESKKSSTFWVFTLSIYFSVIIFFSQFNKPVYRFDNQSQAQIVIEQARAGDSSNLPNQQNEIKNSVDNETKKKYLKKSLG